MKKVICIVGPTGSGKTKLSIKLAKHFKAEIINGDSVSLYEKLDIGSAKITKSQMEGVPHHLISHVKLNEPYTVYHFQQDVRNLITKIDTPIIVGGSGLYIKSALYDYEFDKQSKITYPSLEDMIIKLKKEDPNALIDYQNPRRVESAYRNLYFGDKRSLKQKQNNPLYDIFLIYLDIDRVILKQRLINRLEKMIENGLIEETKALMDYELNIIGYREIKNYLNNQYSLDTAKEAIITSTMRFAKRQRTWFLNQMTPHIYDAIDPNLYIKIIDDVTKFLGVNKT